MKTIKIQILLVVVLLVSGLTIQGMNRTSRIATQSAAARRFVGSRPTTQQQKTPSITLGEEKPEESLWSKISSWLSSGKEETKEEEEEAEEFESAKKEELTSEQLLGKKMQELLINHRGDSVDRHGRSFDKTIFDENDLKNAEEVIRKMIEENPACKEYIIPSNRAYSFDEAHYFGRSYDIKLGTMLDQVFYEIFGGDLISTMELNQMIISDNVLRYIELAQFLIDQGVKINPDNEALYQKCYKYLMNRYRSIINIKEGRLPLSGYNYFSLYGDDYELEMIKEMFEKLDPVLEEAMPGLMSIIAEASKERAGYEEDLELKKQIKEKVNYDIFLQQMNDFIEEQPSSKDYFATFDPLWLYKEWMMWQQSSDFFVRMYERIENKRKK